MIKNLIKCKLLFLYLLASECYSYEAVNKEQILGAWHITHTTFDLFGKKTVAKNPAVFDFRSNGIVVYSYKGSKRFYKYSILRGDIIIDISKSKVEIIKVNKLDNDYMEWDTFFSNESNDWRWKKAPVLAHLKRQ